MTILKRMLTYILCLSCFTVSSANSAEDIDVYLGEQPPGLTPKLFGKGIVSTENRELTALLMPNGREIYVTHSYGNGNYQTFVINKTANGWSDPVRAPFADKGNNLDISLSRDGNTLYFISSRPRPGETEGDRRDLWIAKRKGDDWGEPELIVKDVGYTTATEDGVLYSQADRPEGFGDADLYRTGIKNGKYGKQENLGASVNSSAGEGDVLIAPDESWLIVSSWGRPDSMGSGDLYISFRDEDRSWGDLIHMGPEINSDKLDFCPILSQDGKYIFFSSARRGDPDIFWVSAEVIENYR